ncbi:MAG TPA: hypothetical protein VI818_04025 [Candidatus Thermoplasmatota archaeon]|nr:hypothetical protein [Candidatus Thermoplasmatota archaeon]
MAVDSLLLTSQFAVAAAHLILAGLLLYVEFGSRIHRSFALFLFLRGGLILFNQFGRIWPEDLLYWAHVKGYFLLGILPALAYFFVTYLWRRTTPATWVARGLIFAFALVVEASYFVDHSLLWAPQGPDGLVNPSGPLNSAAHFMPLMAGVALSFSIAAARTPVVTQARFHRLVALAMTSAALVDGGIIYASGFVNGWRFVLDAFGLASWPDLLFDLRSGPSLVTAPLALIALAHLTWTALNDRAYNRARWTIAIGAASLATSFIGLAASDGFLFLFILGIGRIFFPLVVTYAIARQAQANLDPFALDYKMKITVRRGAIGGIFLAMFFVVSEGAQNLLEALAGANSQWRQWSSLIGIFGAGLPVFALSPLQRLGDRLSTTVLPDARPLADLTPDDRLRLYREQAEIAWADGALTRKERLLLDKLRDRLQLATEVAAKVEHSVVKRAVG